MVSGVMKSKARSRGLSTGAVNKDTYNLIVKHWKFESNLKAVELYVLRCVFEM